MNFINNLKIKNKLIFMLIFPIAALLYFALSGVWDKSGQVAEMNNLKILSAIAVKASAVVHETQKERGASALFIGSGGKEFGSELSSQRADTDKR